MSALTQTAIRDGQPGEILLPIFGEPITKQRPEGVAFIVKVVGSPRYVQHPITAQYFAEYLCEVRFPGEKYLYFRKIALEV